MFSAQVLGKWNPLSRISWIPWRWKEKSMMNLVLSRFWKVFFNYFNYRASLNADGEGLEENVKTCAETAQPETDKDENHEPDDAPNDGSAVSTSSAIAFACHFLLNWIFFLLDWRRSCWSRNKPAHKRVNNKPTESKLNEMVRVSCCFDTRWTAGAPSRRSTQSRTTNYFRDIYFGRFFSIGRFM